MKCIMTILMIPFLVFIILSSGCRTAPVYDHTTERNVERADHQLAVNVLNRLRDDDITGRHTFSATAENGVVTVYGSVPDQSVRMRVKGVVEGTPGVESMVDRLHPQR